MEKYFNKKILWGYDNGHLWFLQAIFLIFIFMFIICGKIYEEKKGFLYVTALITLYIASYFSNYVRAIPILCNALKYIVWFYFGFFINHFEKNIITKRKGIISAIISVLLVVIYFIVWKNKLIMDLSAFFIIISLYNVVPNRENKILSLISKNSFGIYLLHSPLIYITYTYYAEKAPIVVVSINFFIFGSLAMLLTMILRNSHLKIIVGE